MNVFFEFNEKFQTVACPKYVRLSWNTATDPLIRTNKRADRSAVADRRSTTRYDEKTYSRTLFPWANARSRTSKRKALIIRKRMTYFAFYVGAVAPWRTYLSRPRHCRRSYTPPPISFAIFLKAYSDGLRLTHLHFHKPVLFYASSIRVVNNSSNV